MEEKTLAAPDGGRIYRKHMASGGNMVGKWWSLGAEQNSALKDPYDFIRLCLDENVRVKLSSNRELHGKLYAYDLREHPLSMILGDVEETTTTVEIDDETFEEITRLDQEEIINANVRTYSGTSTERYIL